MIQFNGLLLVFLLLFVFRSAFQIILDLMNISHLRQHRHSVPRAFQDTVDGEKFAKIVSYTADSTTFGIVARLFDQAVLLAVLLTGLLPWLVEAINGWGTGFIGAGLIFFAILAIFSNIIDIPFELYDTFVIEERYGFNTRTIGLWFSDWAKGLVIAFILGGIVLLVLLVLVSYFEVTWWIFAWVIISIFELVIMWLYPVLIAPLFNKFEPITDRALEQRIASLMEKAGLAVKGVFQMDAGKRSKHTNAYFTGIGRTKRIVLFDTLLASHPEQEILSVLAHEAGHWKRKHVIKQLLLMAVLSLAGLFILSEMLDWGLLYRTFGFEEDIRYVGLLLAPVVLSPLSYFLKPLGSALSRKYEREADDVAVSLMGTPEPMRDTLVRLSADNLANLAPHPTYAWFNYSHPPPVDRIERLEAMAEDDSRNVG
ncbi:MAG: M48 family metallopeptidase [Deltaproteobacteria bacterium]|nr:M48 family metallopeptidase [Deltaproteobacteria bacterium]